jgi:hypothetical protein
MQATFDFRHREPLQISENQREVLLDPSFYGDPLTTSPRIEPDLLPFKPRGEFYLVDAVAHAPGGEAATNWTVSAYVGNIGQTIAVTGERNWRRTLGVWQLDAPSPAVTVPVRFENSFGGTLEDDNHEPVVCDENPVGCGVFRKPQWESRKSIRAPQIHATTDNAIKPFKRYSAVSFGLIHRAWLPRRRFLGTVDEQWKDEQWPLLPKDFDYSYFNCAPTSQQLPFGAYFDGNERCRFCGLHSDGNIEFQLPDATRYHLFQIVDDRVVAVQLNLDTIIFHMAESQVCLVWRVSFPLLKTEAPLFVAPLEVAKKMFKNGKFTYRTLAR